MNIEMLKMVVGWLGIIGILYVAWSIQRTTSELGQIKDILKSIEGQKD